ncbi:MAG: Inositol 2-dehydrogenase/D-chiro-inositol 3-dehydrogenase [Verrucomicrobiae bacterium]|nr:Inositol 2-dehydrogenase/D-chiro-inositol 3-dehydrogenase [Verrucomicrobiae bacterium]
MNTLSFMSANFVARQLGYKMPGGWSQGDTATNDYFRPLATFGERFDAMLAEVVALGFDAIDLWAAHLHFSWATLEHIEIARALLAKHKLRVVSYAGGFGGNVPEFRAACRLCAALNIPVLAGGTGLLKPAQTSGDIRQLTGGNPDRAALVANLREFGLVFGYENHPEKTPGEILDRIGATDTDVIGVAVDTGWFGTQGFDGVAALRQLAPRLKHIHLKDVKARRAAKTGFQMIDMGHETCRLGAGIVGIEACLTTLAEVGYRGAISIEHEPEEFDPRDDVKASKAFVEASFRARVVPPKKQLRYAVVGCGNIAGAYATNLAPYPELKLLGAHDLDPARAQEFTKKFGGKVYATLDEVLADPAVDCVVNLTIHHAHVEVITKCLEAGKHVHTEKPIAMTYADAKRLATLARRQRRRLSCAPVTWLGEAQQTAWKLIRDGQLGTPRVVYAEINWARIETWHPNPAPFYDVGPVFDVAVYPLTMLTAWFGAVRRVTAAGKVVLPDRKTKDGIPYTVTTPDWQTACLEFESGLLARVTASFYVGNLSRTREGLEVHGDAGSLILDSWTNFASAVRFGQFGETAMPVPLVTEPYQGVEFGRGAVELATALREKRPHRNGAEHAAHVVEIMQAILTSVKTGKAVKVKSKFPAPAPMPWAN